MADQPDGTDLLCFNIGGKKYFIMRKNFDRFPETRLGLLVSKLQTNLKVLVMKTPGWKVQTPIVFSDRPPLQALPPPTHPIPCFILIFLKVRCTNTQDKLKYCDKYFDGEIPEFFFDM